MTTPRAVSVAILKGGVGKSTIAVNLADRLAHRGHNVLFVDLDPNGHATEGLVPDAYRAEVHIGNVLLDQTPVREIIRETDYFDVLPSNQELEEVENAIKNGNVIAPYTQLKRKVVNPVLGTAYDYIVTDSGAYRGLLSDSALVATGNIIIPVQAREEVLEGLQKTFEDQVFDLQTEVGLDIIAIVPNDFSSANSEERRIIEELNAEFREYLPSFAQMEMLESSPGPGIRHRIAFSRAYREQMPLGRYDPENDQLERLDELARIVETGGVQHE